MLAHWRAPPVQSFHPLPVTFLAKGHQTIWSCFFLLMIECFKCQNLAFQPWPRQLTALNRPMLSATQASAQTMGSLSATYPSPSPGISSTTAATKKIIARRNWRLCKAKIALFPTGWQPRQFSVVPATARNNTSLVCCTHSIPNRRSRMAASIFSRLAALN